MFVKICANTTLSDTLLSVKAGADAVGFVFAPSKRQVTASEVAGITRDLPGGIVKIGVFDSQDANEIIRDVETAALTGVQLHGALDLPLAQELRRHFSRGVLLIQTLHWQIDNPDAEASVRAGLHAAAQEKLRLGALTRPLFDAILLDSRLADSPSGGTGRSFDWTHAARLLAEIKSPPRILLAGGLNPGNVAEAIQALHPWGVDVASGTELSPGKKDPEKIRAFLRNARAAAK